MELTPQGRLGEVDGMADAALFPSSDVAGFITAAGFITGAGLPVDGGMGT